MNICPNLSGRHWRIYIVDFYNVYLLEADDEDKSR